MNRLQGLVHGLAALLLVFVCARSGFAQELVSPLIRTTIGVEDIDESLPLYRDVLGLSVWRDMTMSGPEVNGIIGTQGQTVRIVILQSADSTVGNVALFEFSRPGDVAKVADKRGFGVGDVALVMNTQDIELIHERVKDLGLTIVSSPSVLFPRPTWKSQTYEMMFITRDGIFINVIQRGVPGDSVESGESKKKQ